MRLPLRGRAFAAGLGIAIAAAGCAHPPAPHEERIAAASRGIEDDASIRARLAEVEAAKARERGAPAFDEFQLRVAEAYDGKDHAMRFLTRVPVPDPGRLRSVRAMRTAETEESVARLEETALERNAEDCFRAIERGVYDEYTRLYEGYAERQRELLAWNEESRASGFLNEAVATRFEIERRVKLAERMPDPAPVGPTGDALMPGIEGPPQPLDRDPALIRDLVRRRHPAAAVRSAVSDRYAAMFEQAKSSRRPWFDFVDLAYEAQERGDDEIAGQVAIRVPFGSAARADANHFRALQRAELRGADQVVDEHARLGERALLEIERFEANKPRWRELLDLAEEADQVAERWWRERLAPPSQVVALFDEAYEARSSVLEARERAGLASCRLLEVTGVWVGNWPRAE